MQRLRSSTARFVCVQNGRSVLELHQRLFLIRHQLTSSFVDGSYHCERVRLRRLDGLLQLCKLRLPEGRAVEIAKFMVRANAMVPSRFVRMLPSLE